MKSHSSARALMSFLLFLFVIGFISAQAPDCGAQTTSATTPAPCPKPHQIRVDCPGCERTCANLRNPPTACPDFCVAGGICVCDVNFYENAAENCVPANQCPRVPIPKPNPGPIKPLPE